MASVRGTVQASILDRPLEPLVTGTVRLASVEGASPSLDAGVNRGGFEFLGVPPGWYVLAVSADGFGETVRGIHVVDGSNEPGPLDVRYRVCSESAETVSPRIPPILTVCEALKGGFGYPCYYRPVVVVGIFKSGMDETLRLDCPEQLVSGDVGWPSAIGLTNPLPPPEALRAEIEKKRQEVLKSSPPEAPLRPERVVGLYGHLASLAGLTAAPCCKAPVETVLPPARLFGLSERDPRVIR